MKPIVAITNATGMVYAVHLLETFYRLNAETCLIMSRDAEAALIRETGHSMATLKKLASCFCFAEAQTLSSIAEEADSMVIIPCQVESIAAMTHGLPQNALQKAAATMLDGRKKLILVTSEPRLETQHLEIMLHMAYKGAIIMPYMPSFYHRPASIEDIVSHHTGRIFDLLNIEHNMVKRWGLAE